jgi:hypothetical protein
MMGAPAAVDWTLVNTRAATWAKGYSFELVKGIDETSKTALQDAISKYYQAPMTRAELEAEISKTFSPARASRIAVTETTRAAVEGDLEIAREIRAAGIEMVTVWLTDNDDKVCDICEPLNQKYADGEKDGRPYWIHPDGSEIEPPPAHVECRCDIGNEIP